MDQKKLKEVFYAESQELIEQFEENLVALEEANDDIELADAIFRTAHTIKSNAAAVGLTAISNFVHTMENVLERIRNRELGVAKKLISSLLSSSDFLKKMGKSSILCKESPDEAKKKKNSRINRSIAH